MTVDPELLYYELLGVLEQKDLFVSEEADEQLADLCRAIVEGSHAIDS